MDEIQEFQPERIPRRGEISAWGLALLAFAGWAAMTAAGLRVHWLYIFLALFLLISGALISLTNWVDRRTRLRLEPGGVAYEDGLRRVRMDWRDIAQVHVLPAAPGKLIRVIGEDRKYFSFRTFGEVIMGGKSRGRVGFAQGEHILDVIIEKSRLKPVDPPQAGRSGRPAEGYYYARE
jgi:hypothetical protein